MPIYLPMGFPGGSDSKKSAVQCSAGDLGLISGSGRFPGESNGNSLQYSCLGNPMDRGAWQGSVHGVARVRHNLATKPPPPCIYLHCDLYLHGFELLSSFLSFHLPELSWAFLGQVRSSGHKLPLVLFIWKCLYFLPPPPFFSFLIFTVLCSLQDFNSLTRNWTQTILVKAWDPNH